MPSPSLARAAGPTPFWDGALDLRVAAVGDAHDARSIVVPFDLVAPTGSHEPARALDITLHRDPGGVDVLVHRLGPGATVHVGRDGAPKVVFVARGLGRVQTGHEVVDVAAEQSLDAGAGAVTITAGREGATAIVISHA
jgi:hypothetical protein